MKKNVINCSRLKVIVVDLDGVVYFGNKAVHGAAAAIQDLRSTRLKIFFLTNNSCQSREEIAAKLNTMGIRCSLDEIISSGYATALFIKRWQPQQPVLIIGSDSLKREFKMMGLSVITTAKPGILVVGLDRNFHYDEIAAGLNALHQGARFVACNKDAAFPVNSKRFLPGCGAMVAAIEAAALRKADYVIGKPNTYMIELIAASHFLKPRQILIIGDRIDSDIVMAEKFGSPAILITNESSAGVITARSLQQAAMIICQERKTRDEN